MSYKKFILIFMTTAVVMVSMQPILFFGSMGIQSGIGVGLDEWVIFKRNAAEKATSPKMVLLSGSNSLFGLSAEMMEEELDIPVINLGLNIQIKEYIFYAFKEQIRPGDIVILPLEYLYYQLSPTDGWGLLYLLRYDEEYFKNYFAQLPLSQKIKSVYDAPFKPLLKDLLRALYYSKEELMEKREKEIREEIRDPNNPYSVRNFNKHGDTTTNTTNRINEPEKYRNVFGNDVPNEKSKTELHQFIQWCRENDIKVYLAWPSYLIKGQAFNEHDAAQIRKIEQFMADENVEILGSYKDNLLDVKKFDDLDYHLNTEGKAIRTRILLDEIRNNVQLKEYIDSIKQ